MALNGHNAAFNALFVWIRYLI